MVGPPKHVTVSDKKDPTAVMESGTPYETCKKRFEKNPTFVFFEDSIRVRNERNPTCSNMSEKSHNMPKHERLEAIADEVAVEEVAKFTKKTSETLEKSGPRSPQKTIRRGQQKMPSPPPKAKGNLLGKDPLLEQERYPRPTKDPPRWNNGLYGNHHLAKTAPKGK